MTLQPPDPDSSASIPRELDSALEALGKRSATLYGGLLRAAEVLKINPEALLNQSEATIRAAFTAAAEPIKETLTLSGEPSRESVAKLLQAIEVVDALKELAQATGGTIPQAVEPAPKTEAVGSLLQSFKKNVHFYELTIPPLATINDFGEWLATASERMGFAGLSNTMSRDLANFKPSGTLPIERGKSYRISIKGPPGDPDASAVYRLALVCKVYIRNELTRQEQNEPHPLAPQEPNPLQPFAQEQGEYLMFERPDGTHISVPLLD